MQSRRVAKASQAIKEVVSTTILFGLRDPRIKNVTVIAAEAAPDLTTAKIYISVRGDAKDEALTLKGLESARGLLQAKIADRIQTRHTPILSFVIDRGVKRSLETSRILREDGVAEAQNGTDDATESDEEE
jgi:ribosome-binding factor A